MEPEEEPSSPLAIAVTASVFYGLMAGLAALIAHLGDVDLEARLTGSTSDDSAGVLVDTAIGAGAGLAIVALTWLMRGLGPMTRVRRELATLLGPLSSGTIAVLAITSAVGEELLFRGALQPLIGFWPTAILFGALHGGFTPKLWTWTVFAILAGILLGWLADVTGNLLAPILCHLTVNYFNLHALTAEVADGGRDPDPEDPRGGR